MTENGAPAGPGGQCRKIVFLALFGAALGYFEAAVVVYLREIFYPGGFEFPLKMMDRATLIVELGREAASVAILATLAAISGRKFAERLAHFMLVFALWDIFYYVWLKVLIGWPPGLFTRDILFLIPLPWIGPVLSPLVVSLCMIAGAVLILRRLARGGVFAPNLREWFFALAGAGLIILSYVIDTRAGLGGEYPAPYRWDLLAAGLAVGFYGFLRSLRRTRHVAA